MDSSDVEVLPKDVAELQRAKKIATFCYLMQLLGVFFFAVPSVIAVIVAYQKRPFLSGTRVGTHFEWQIKSFWWALAMLFVAMLLLRFGIGLLLLPLVSLWFLYRVIKGWLALYEERGMDPQRFF